jgi:hypothetical protein
LSSLSLSLRAFVFVVPFATACTSSPTHGDPCPRPVPAFRVELTAAVGGLPPDTTLNVLYGGNQSGTYSIHSGSSTSEDVCCHTGVPTSGPLPHVACDSQAPNDGGPAQALLCELWTDGLAEVQVRATGYHLLDQVFQAEVTDPNCGVDTVDELMVLRHGDGSITSQ